MKCRIRKAEDFSNAAHADVVSADVYLKSIYDNVSSFEVVGITGDFKTGDILYYGGYLGVIRDFERNQSTASINCLESISLFDMDVPVITGSYADAESAIAAVIDAYYISQPDAVYARPYMQTVKTSATASAVSPDAENGIFNIKSWIRKAQRMIGVSVTCAVNGNALDVTIGKAAAEAHNIFLHSGQYEVVTESRSNDRVGKVTTVAEDNGQVRNWYKLTDGTITQTYTDENRIYGRWVSVSVSEDANALESAQDEFSETEYSHLIEFYTDKKMNFLDTLNIRSADGTVYKSYVSGVRISANDDRYLYQSGEMRINLEDKLLKGKG